ncbi:uncharacterized protein LOC122326360 isoform X2 [Puntigrus tetrazona]|uniref:uncharacterized protein LOC122326360 isoform X2 n=1 Tax=Puntigrus tetrazona TaxID=1606681 RepID=UPI001C8A2137|nr:uncharacterized protein LOC122326360 isoform X2 [Puntigrus tetrazona]
MIVRKASRGKPTGRNVTPMRAAPSYGFQRRGRQLSKLKANKCNKDSFRVAKAAGRRLIGQSLFPGGRRGDAEVASASSASSQLSTSVTMPSGVSSFLLDCLDADSPASSADTTLSSIEEFRRADSYDEAAALPAGDVLLNAAKNSTLLDHSRAQDLTLLPPPNLSSILELSVNPAEEKPFSLSHICLSPLHVPSEALASDTASGCALKWADERTPRLVVPSPVVKKCFAEKEKPVKHRKVTFSDVVSVRNVSSRKRCARDQQGPGDVSSGPVKFFDFASELERDSFFRRLQQTRSFMFPAKPVIYFVVAHIEI